MRRYLIEFYENASVVKQEVVNEDNLWIYLDGCLGDSTEPKYPMVTIHEIGKCLVDWT